MNPTLGPIAVAALCLLWSASGCSGCEGLPFDGDSPPDPATLSGTWLVSGYASDEEGCQPESGSGSIEHVELTVIDDEESTRIDILPCVSATTCAKEVTPDYQLYWNPQLRRGERIHHYGSLKQSNPVETQCRLASTRVVLMLDGDEMKLTRSHYHIDLPVEGDESCDPSLAHQYHPQMTCNRSQVFDLVRPDEPEADAPPNES